MTRILTTSRDCPAESLNWLCEIIRHSEASERGPAHTAVFSYCCFRICIDIKRLIVDGADPENFLARSESLLQQVDGIENTTYQAINQMELSLGPYQVEEGTFGNRIVHSDFKMRLLSHALELLLHISHIIPSCTLQQQRNEFCKRQDCFMKEFQNVAESVLLSIATLHNMQSVIECDDDDDDPKRNIGSNVVIRWSHVLRVTHPLQLISQSRFALDWQRTAAKKILKFMYTRVEAV